ncbi:MAG: NAD(P)/FAD-dependent oxidoreductase [Planctomycetota bacterium]|jgi:protoporphyrinogen oxidase
MSDTNSQNNPYIVIGAGPAGLAAGLKLSENGKKCLIIEKSDSVGGLSKTIERNGFRFDLGGHRFFTTSTKVNELWHKTLQNEFIKSPRKSRIFYKNKFFNYPITVDDTLKKLGLLESALVGLSFLKAKILPPADTRDLETWICSLFGRRLYKHFFKSYTEKVWGIPCSEISSTWGAQRIKGLDLISIVKNAVTPGKGEIKTLIDEFHYPRLGPGQMYEKMAADFQALGGEILFNTQADKIICTDNKAVELTALSEKEERTIPCSHIISSMPFTELTEALRPSLNDTSLNAAGALRYRSFITVNLYIDSPATIPDTWLYIHDPDYQTGRVQCFKNWSADMVPDSTKSSLGCEFFVTEGDELWNAPEGKLVKMAKTEVERLGLVKQDLIYDGFAVRVEKAYPVFDLNYAENVSLIRKDLDKISNLQPVGRYGMFKYNNMDHSILTGILAAENCLGENHDVWSASPD